MEGNQRFMTDENKEKQVSYSNIFNIKNKYLYICW